MNSKKTNRISAILNIVLLLTLALMLIFGKNIGYTVISGKDGGATFFRNGIVDLLVNSENTVPIIVFISISLFSIISAIQNKDDKKMLYWKIILSIAPIITIIQMILYSNTEYEIEEWLGRIFFGIVPIILAIINLVLIKKNRPKVIQVISYIVVILSSILVLLDIWHFNLLEYVGIVWCAIAVIMQLIYTHIQEDDDESKQRKIANIIIYYILQAIIAIGLFIFIVYCLLVCKVNSEKLKNETINIANQIYEQSTNNKEELILVEKNSKYGFINEKGEEVIKTEYDIISNLFTFNINDKDCEYAFAKKGNDFYIILNSKNIIDLKETNSEYFKNIYEIINSKFNTNEEEQNKSSLMMVGITYLSANENVKNAKNNTYSSSDEKELKPDNEDFNDDYNYVYTYNLKNGLQMIITEIEIDADEEEYEYNLITKKNNQIIQNDKNVVIPIDLEGNIKLYSNGNIPFCNLQKNIQGWYDVTTGQAMSLQGNYQILDVTNNNYLLIRDYNTSEKNEMIVDGNTGNVIAQGKYIDKIENGYIITDKSKKMYFVDETGNVKSQQFDCVMDISTKGNGLLMCANKTSNGLECKLMDSKGNILTKQSYSKLGNNINWDYFFRDDNYYDDERTTEYYFDDVYEEYYKNVRASSSKNMIYTIPNDFKKDTENEEENFIPFERTKEDYGGKDTLWFSKTDEYYSDLEDYLLDVYEIKIGDTKVSEEQINGIKWNKIVYNSPTVDKKVTYIYITKDGDFYYEFAYVDFENNNNSTIEQIKSTLVLN